MYGIFNIAVKTANTRRFKILKIVDNNKKKNNKAAVWFMLHLIFGETVNYYEWEFRLIKKKKTDSVI